MHSKPLDSRAGKPAGEDKFFGALKRQQQQHLSYVDEEQVVTYSRRVRLSPPNGGLNVTKWRDIIDHLEKFVEQQPWWRPGSPCASL